MIRVLTFGRFADENFGGLERYVFELARSLSGDVAYANIVASRGKPPDVEKVACTVYARPIAYVAGAPVCPSMPIHAMRLHKANPFQLVHLQFPADPMAHIATLTLPRTVRRVITWHSDIVRQRTSLRFYRPFLKRLVQSADAIIVPTPAHFTSSQQLRQWVASDRTRIVPFGVDHERFARPPARASDIRQRYHDAFLVFALGRHVYYKGFEYLIRAMREMPGVQAIIGGKGPLTEHLAALSHKLGVTDRVHLVGRIADADLPAYYHACDVFCMPSVERAEAFGIVQLEAMASGKPVVCCKLGNGVNWVNVDGTTGLAVEPRDPVALAKALGALRDNPELRRRLGEQGRRRATADFSLEGMARGTLDAYRDALSRPLP